MSLINILLNKDVIGGLEISDSGLRFSLLKKNKLGLTIDTLAESKFSARTTKDGEAKDKEALAGELASFVKKHRIKYAIVSLPNDQIFTKTYIFPTVMPEEKIPSSVKMIIDFQLPAKKDDIYHDWERTDDKKNKRALLAYLPKTAVSSLTAQSKSTGLKIIAIESHALSLARAIKQTPDETLLIIERNGEETSFSTIRNNRLLFSQSLPNEKIGANLATETEKVLNYHDWFEQTVAGAILIGDFSPKEIKSLPVKTIDPEIGGQIKSSRRLTAAELITVGAALRGLTPRKEDTMISLMETGTEEAFSQAKANSVVNFLLGTTIALSLFFILALSSVWLLVGNIQNNFNDQIISQGAVPTGSGAALFEARAESFNSLIGQTGVLATKEPSWYTVIQEIRSRLTPGIAIGALSLPGPEIALSISGTAGSRDDINALKKSFAASPLFSEVDVPLNNLGKKTEIPFSLSFKIKSPESVYQK